MNRKRTCGRGWAWWMTLRSVFVLLGILQTSPGHWGNHGVVPAFGSPPKAPPITHIVCVASGIDGAVGCHRAGGGSMTGIGKLFHVYDSRWLYASRDQKQLYVGGMFEPNNVIGSVTAFRVTRNGSLIETGYWFTGETVPVSMWEHPTRSDLYVSTLDSLLRYRSSRMADLRAPQESDKSSAVGEGKIGLYTTSRGGKLVLNRVDSELIRKADFDASTAAPGRYLLYHGGKILPLSKTGYFVRARDPSVMVYAVGKGRPFLSLKQQVRLPKIAPGLSLQKLGRLYEHAVIARHPNGHSLYVATGRSGGDKIYRFAIRPDELLSPRPEQSVTTNGGSVDGIAFSPDGKYLYVIDATRDQIHTFPTSREGRITHTKPKSIRTLSATEAIAVLKVR